MKKHLMFVSAQSALLFTLISGCDDTRHEEQTGEFEAKPAVLKSALERPIQSCQRTRLSCRREADDRASRAACDDALASCLESAAERAIAVAEALRECRDDALECVRDGERRSTCRAQFEGCVERALADEPTPRDAGDDGEEPARGDAGVDAPDEEPGTSPENDAGSDGPPAEDADAGADEADGDASDGDTPASEGDAGSEDAASEDGDDTTPSDEGAAPGDQGASDAGAPDDWTSDRGALPSLDASVPDGMPESLQCVTRMRLCVARDPRSASTCAEEAQSCLDRS